MTRSLNFFNAYEQVRGIVQIFCSGNVKRSFAKWQTNQSKTGLCGRMSLQSIYQNLVGVKKKIPKVFACILIVCLVLNGVDRPTRLLWSVT